MTPSADRPTHTLQHLAAVLGADLVGDGTAIVGDIAHPAMVTGAGVLALAMDEGSERALAASAATIAIVAPGRAAALARLSGGLVAPRPRYALAQLLELFDRPPHAAAGIHPSAVIDPSAEIGPGASIGPLCVIGPRARVGARSRVLAHASIGADAVVGEDCLLHSGVRLGERCVLGNRVIVQPNATIGSDGFGFVTPERGSVESARETGRVEAQNLRIVRINSIGNVVVGDDVEIGSNTCIDRGTLGSTRIGRGTKIDNLVQIGHNCTIGENCLIAGMVGISGSATVGNRVTLAGRVGIADHLKVGDDAIVMAGSGVGQSVPAREIWAGFPAQPRAVAERLLRSTLRLPRIHRDVEDLKTRVTGLERKDR